MDKQVFNQFCSEQTGAHFVEQWGGSQVWKVGGKVFAIGVIKNGALSAVTFKASPMNFDYLAHSEGYIPAPYFASRGMKWIQQQSLSAQLDEPLRYYLRESYRLVAQGLSKAKQAELGLRE